MVYQNKGFTLIELMIIIMIIGISAAFVVPQFHKYSVQSKAETAIKDGVKVSSIENVDVRNRVIDMLKDKRIEDKKIKVAQQMQDNNTVIPVLKPETVPQSSNNTVIPVFMPDMVITCRDRDSLMSRCTLNLNQRGKRYTIPMNCELTEFNTYKCEVM